jgi:hypothetical protein
MLYTQVIEAINSYKMLPKALMVKYFPNHVTNRHKRSLELLISVYCNPNKTISTYKALCRNLASTTETHLFYLVDLGYIERNTRRRLITQIGAWKKEYIYKVSPTGESVLKTLLEANYKD